MSKKRTLKQLRKLRNWTQTELQVASGVDISTISKVERNLQAPSPNDRKKLANAFGVETSQIDLPVCILKSKYEFLKAAQGA